MLLTVYIYIHSFEWLILFFNCFSEVLKTPISLILNSLLITSIANKWRLKVEIVDSCHFLVPFLFFYEYQVTGRAWRAPGGKYQLLSQSEL